MSLKLSYNCHRFLTQPSSANVSTRALNQSLQPLHTLNLAHRFESSSWTIERKDAQGHRLKPLPFIGKNGLSFINGYRQSLFAKLSSLGIDENIAPSFVSKSLMSPVEQTNITLGCWFSLLAAKNNILSECHKFQYISQALNIELFLSSLMQSRCSNLEPMGMPSAADLHESPNTIQEKITTSIGRSFGSMEEFKKMVAHLS
ncbi:hypothetical protein MDAP_000255 [Mitosporidium daphniae]|uniref:Uncharacterized protein n=1 Tax=Mitosporidium daphniae TaxID=1485682 RepID=A0A098VVC9_9MICR|nr:uncharacterized protein DI09_12p450 [Mitosporidium daphniae]KGG52877.1 hypothetical protein DI09_12p450 [Mitosporidium daphniae]|eukprot:XP_013239304.1 uncharacterized protein DI09_12p450 [Mitosporidium daphniae]